MVERHESVSKWASSKPPNAAEGVLYVAVYRTGCRELLLELCASGHVLGVTLLKYN